MKRESVSAAGSPLKSTLYSKACYKEQQKLEIFIQEQDGATKCLDVHRNEPIRGKMSYLSGVVSKLSQEKAPSLPCIWNNGSPELIKNLLLGYNVDPGSSHPKK